MSCLSPFNTFRLLNHQPVHSPPEQLLSHYWAPSSERVLELFGILSCSASECRVSLLLHPCIYPHVSTPLRGLLKSQLGGAGIRPGLGGKTQGIPDHLKLPDFLYTHPICVFWAFSAVSWFRDDKSRSGSYLSGHSGFEPWSSSRSDPKTWPSTGKIFEMFKN